MIADRIDSSGRKGKWESESRERKSRRECRKSLENWKKEKKNPHQPQWRGKGTETTTELLTGLERYSPFS